MAAKIEKKNAAKKTAPVQEALKAPAPKTEKKPQANASTVESPVALVHATCEKMKGAPRKEIMAALLAKGVNNHTASTQIQRWRSMQKK